MRSLINELQNIQLVAPVSFSPPKGKAMKQQRWSYFRSKWNLLELSIILLSWCAVALLTWRTVTGKQEMTYYQEHPGRWGWQTRPHSAFCLQGFTQWRQIWLGFCLSDLFLQYNENWLSDLILLAPYETVLMNPVLCNYNSISISLKKLRHLVPLLDLPVSTRRPQPTTCCSIWWRSWSCCPPSSCATCSGSTPRWTSSLLRWSAPGATCPASCSSWCSCWWPTPPPWVHTLPVWKEVALTSGAFWIIRLTNSLPVCKDFKSELLHNNARYVTTLQTTLFHSRWPQTHLQVSRKHQNLKSLFTSLKKKQKKNRDPLAFKLQF